MTSVRAWPTDHAVRRWAERVRANTTSEADREDLMRCLAVSEECERPDWLIDTEEGATFRAAADVVFVLQGPRVVTVMTRWDHGGVSVALRFHARFLRRARRRGRERRHAPHDETYSRRPTRHREDPE
jgi:hypothetical protein